MATHTLLPTLLRTAKIEDLEQLMALESRCFSGDRISARSFRSFFKTDSSRLIVAVDKEDVILGYAAILLRDGSSVARLYSLAVDPDKSKLGIGTQLLGGAEAITREQACDRLSLEVRKDNERALALYTKHGYEVETELPAYYEDGTDGVRLVRHIDHMPDGSSPANRSRLPIILVDRLKDLANVPKGCHAMTVRDYLALEYGVPGRRVLNLSRSYEPLSLGYYCSLLASARKERCLPEADALLDINWKRIHKRALLSLQALLDEKGEGIFPDVIDVYFGRTPDKRFKAIARQAFDLFRCPIIRINLDQAPGVKITEIEALAIHRLSDEAKPNFDAALRAFLKGSLPKPAIRKIPSTIVSILVNPDEQSPPSDAKALDAFVTAAESVDARAELITAKDYRRLMEFDALFIRETTALNHHTYRFAKRALQEGMPVIDDPHSILCCTNKIFLAELLRSNRVLTPKTVIFDRQRMKQLADDLQFPGIVKIPDGCFSRGVHKVKDAQELKALGKELFKQTDLLMMQEYLPTDYDWRIGILDGQPLYACKYYMVSGNWKIYEYEKDGSISSGDSETLPISEVPQEVLNVALRGTQLIGNGFYGVDIKETVLGPSIIEINDNPSIDFGIEDSVLGSALYQRLMAVLVSRVGRS
nr:GNAT family N-acetyltransferase [uncultured Cohaesibacter sp.]